MTRSRAADLQHYSYARLYEKTFCRRKHDAEYYSRLCERVRPHSILEYGAGAGRITLPLLRSGHDITALDASKSMLALLEERSRTLPGKVRAGLTIVQGDMRKKRLMRRFPLVLATFNVVAHLPTFRDMAAFVRRARDHLEKDGLLVFDVSLPHPNELEADPDELHPAPRFKHPDTGEWIRQTERFEYDPSTQTLLVESQLRPEGGGDAVTIPLHLRQWFPKEVEALLKYEGFRSIETQADFTEQPGLLAVDSMVFLARPRAPTPRKHDRQPPR